MNNKSKIAIVSNTSWSIYNFRLGLIRSLKSKGYQVVVIAPKDNFTAKLISEEIEFEEIQIKNYGTNPFTELVLVYQLYKIYKRAKPNLIFHYTIKPNLYGSISAYLNKIPSIAITTGLGHLFDFKNIFIRWITLGLYKLGSKLSKEVWFLNDNDRDIFVYKNILNRSKTKVLKSEGINTSWFKPTQEKDKNANNFLFAGRLLWDKGVNEFVEAAKYFRKNYENINFELLGFVNQNNPNSVPYEKINEWQKMGVIKFLGETTDVRPYLQNTSCVLFPSYYREGVSRILMEAASMETPIITTNQVGCKNVVDDGRNGFLVKPQDVNDLIEKIEQFLSLDYEDKLVMGKLGRKKMVREYSEEKVISEYHLTIEKYLGTMSSKTSKIKTN